MIELGCNKPIGLEEIGQKIDMPETMPQLKHGEALICAYDLLGIGEKKHVICLDDDDLQILRRSYNPSSLEWYIYNTPQVTTTKSQVAVSEY